MRRRTILLLLAFSCLVGAFAAYRAKEAAAPDGEARADGGSQHQWPWQRLAGALQGEHDPNDEPDDAGPPGAGDLPGDTRVYALFLVSEAHAEALLAQVPGDGGLSAAAAARRVYGRLSAPGGGPAYTLRFPAATADPAPWVRKVLEAQGAQAALPAPGEGPAHLSPAQAAARLAMLDGALTRAGGAKALASRAALAHAEAKDPGLAARLGRTPPEGAALTPAQQAAAKGDLAGSAEQLILVVRHALADSVSRHEALVLTAVTGSGG